MKNMHFKAWENVLKKMFDVEYVMYHPTHVVKLRHQDNCTHFRYVELLKYTGKNDKRGTEVFEGDVLQDSEATYKVVWDDECSWFDMVRLETNDNMRWFGSASASEFADIAKESIVIGNIYENPELIK